MSDSDCEIVEVTTGPSLSRHANTGTVFKRARVDEATRLEVIHEDNMARRENSEQSWTAWDDCKNGPIAAGVILRSAYVA